MLIPISKRRFSPPLRAFVTVLVTSFLMTTIIPAPVGAQMLPSPILYLKPTDIYQPLTIKGIQLVPDNPLRFDFLVDKGNAILTDSQLREESTSLIKYFLTALTIPEKDLWVNLSPYEKDNIIAESFGKTQMGKVFLEQDYILKQMTASLTYPERPIGQQFWSRVYQKAQQLYGTTDIPLDAVNKVWVVPKTADVVSYKNGVMLVDSQLEVMVESDYLAYQQNLGLDSGEVEERRKLYVEILKSVIIPELHREVNEGKAFAQLRQVYQAMIMAVWYKRHLRESVLSKIYVRQNKIDGVSTDDPLIAEKVYAQYVEAFRKGVYNYIREDFDETTKEIVPRKYTSGGLEFAYLGLGGSNDKYREVNPYTYAAFRFTDGPWRVSTDLTLVSSTGQQMAIPQIAPIAESNQIAAENNSKQISFGSQKIGWRWLKTIIVSSTIGVILGLSSFDSSAAQFELNDKGEIVVNVERGDTYGKIIVDLRAAYQAVDYESFKRSQLNGPMWGKGGVVDRLSDGSSPNQLKPGDQLTLTGEALPRVLIEKLIKRSITPQTVTQLPELLTGDDLVEPASSVLSIPTLIPGVVSQEFSKEPPLRTDVTGAILSFSTIWAIFSFFSFGKRRKESTNVQTGLSSQMPPNVALTRDPLILDDSHEIPAWDMEAQETVQAPEGVQPSSQPVRSLEKVEPLSAIIETDHDPKPAQNPVIVEPGNPTVSLAPSPKSIRWIDSLSWILGVGIAGFSSNWDLETTGLAALFIPFLTRAALAVQLLIHEFLGHFIPAMMLSDQRSNFFNISNAVGNYSWQNWMDILNPFSSLSNQNKTPTVKHSSKGWRERFINLSGFFTTLGVSIAASIESSNIWLPLLGPVGITSLAVLLGSFRSDVQGRKTIGSNEDVSCSGAECGIFGVLWADESNDIYPQWAREGLTKLVDALIVRGGQSAGEFAIGLGSTGDNQNTDSTRKEIPILSKVLKYKRGSDLTQRLDQEFGSLVSAMRKKKVTSTEYIKGILGHVRFATGGKVTKEASHPHMGVEEEHLVWEVINGQWRARMVNIFAAIGHNGDNDNWNIWGLKLDLKHMRELFPAIFRMQKTFKVKNENANELQYEALPPGDSPPIALQIHYLLTRGDWLASARYSFTENLFTAFEDADAMNEKELSSFVDKRVSQAVSKLLTAQEEKLLGEKFEFIFRKHQGALLLSDFESKNKGFKDLWVTPSDVKKRPILEKQLLAINAFREELRQYFEDQITDNTEVGAIIKKLDSTDAEAIGKFVDMAVLKFFTGNREASVKEFARRAQGSYGLGVRTSKEPNGITLYSSDQGITIGYNQRQRLVSFSSEHSTLQFDFGDKGKMDDLIFINPEAPGQLADVNMSADRTNARPITIKVFSFSLNRYMSKDEVADQQFPQDLDNPYWTPQVTYGDKDDIVMTDIATIPKEVKSARESWSDKNSFNRQSAEAYLGKLVSRHLELMIKSNSEYYGSAVGNLLARLFEKSTECLTAGGCSVQDAQQRSALLNSRIQTDSRILEFLKSRIDWVVANMADDLAERRINGELSEIDILVYFRTKLDQRLGRIIDKEIKEIAEAVIVGNLKELQSWRVWMEDQKVTRELNTEYLKENGVSKKVETGVLATLKKIISGFLGSKEVVSNKEGQSLSSGDIDLAVFGYEDSMWLGENFVNLLNVVFPKMNIWATSANKAFDLTGDHKIGRRTLSMIFSKSGATYPSRGIVRRLKQLSPGNIFAMTSRVDTLIAMGLGQKFRKDSPFIQRIFVTGNYYPAEANSVGEVALFTHQIELALYLAEGMRKLFPEQRPWGMEVTDADLNQLRALRDKMYDESRRLTGHNNKGQKIDKKEILNILNERLKAGYFLPSIRRGLNELNGTINRKLDMEDIRHLITRIVIDDSQDRDPELQAAFKDIWAFVERKHGWQSFAEKLLSATNADVRKLNEDLLNAILINLFVKAAGLKSDSLVDSYLGSYNSIVSNSTVIGKRMAETGIAAIATRLFVIGIFLFSAPTAFIFKFFGVELTPYAHLIPDLIIALFFNWNFAIAYRKIMNLPLWSRLGPPNILLGDPISALHQTNEGFWSKLNSLAFGSMSMDIHGANAEDHFVARLAYRVSRGTIAIFGVPDEASHQGKVIVSMKQTKAIINGAILNFFKGGAQVFSIGRGKLNNPDVTDHHIDIGTQNLNGASTFVKSFNHFSFDSLGRHIAYKVLFAEAHNWATRWDPKVTIFGRTISLKTIRLWNPAWTYSRTGIHTTRSPIGGSSEALPEYLDPSKPVVSRNLSVGEVIGETVSTSNAQFTELGEVELAQGQNAPQPQQQQQQQPQQQLQQLQQQQQKSRLPGEASQTDLPTDLKGGIDFNTKWLDLRVTSQGEVNLFIDNQNIEFVPIKGIVPNIIDIKPLNLNVLLSQMKPTDEIVKNEYLTKINRYVYRYQAAGRSSKEESYVNT